MKKKKIHFDHTEEQHARFRLQLRYDGISQRQFYITMMDSYIDRDPQLIEFINRILIGKRTKSPKKIKKDFEKEKQINEDFALNEDEIKNIFDMIAIEDPDT